MVLGNPTTQKEEVVEVMDRAARASLRGIFSGYKLSLEEKERLLKLILHDSIISDQPHLHSFAQSVMEQGFTHEALARVAMEHGNANEALNTLHRKVSLLHRDGKLSPQDQARLALRIGKNLILAKRRGLPVQIEIEQKSKELITISRERFGVSDILRRELNRMVRRLSDGD